MTVRDLSDGTHELVLETRIRGASPDQVFAWWTEPAKLARWWPPEAELDLRVGGHYTYTWSSMGWHLRGTFSSIDPGRELAFSWGWDHETPDQAERHVKVTLVPSLLGTLLTVRHGPYGDGEAEAEDRLSHLQGWEHFLDQLQQAIQNDP